MDEFGTVLTPTDFALVDFELKDCLQGTGVGLIMCCRPKICIVFLLGSKFLTKVGWAGLSP